VHLADHFLVSAPVAQLLASRLVQVLGDAITADIVQLAFSERSGTAVPLSKQFLARCVVVFCNVPSVVTTPDRSVPADALLLAVARCCAGLGCSWQPEGEQREQRCVPPV
jgi:hypothetical protein